MLHNTMDNYVTLSCLFCNRSGLVEQQVPESPEMVCCHKLLEFCQRLTKTVGEGKAAQRQLKVSLHSAASM